MLTGDYNSVVEAYKAIYRRAPKEYQVNDFGFVRTLPYDTKAYVVLDAGEPSISVNFGWLLAISREFDSVLFDYIIGYELHYKNIVRMYKYTVHIDGGAIVGKNKELLSQIKRTEYDSYHEDEDNEFGNKFKDIEEEEF